MPIHIERRAGTFQLYNSLTRERFDASAFRSLSEAIKARDAVQLDETLLPEHALRAVLMRAAYDPTFDHELEQSAAAKSVPSLRGILESSIHEAFTVAADRLLALGYITRDQRIRLSGLIGEMLTSFGDTLPGIAPEILVDPEHVLWIVKKTWKEKTTPSNASPLVTYKSTDGAHRWVLRSSGAFKDRTGQIVSRQALDSMVSIANWTGFRGPLRWWHIKAVDMGECDFQFAHEGWLYETGTFFSDVVAEFVNMLARFLGASIGFLYPTGQPFEDGSYDLGAIFERSLLPASQAAYPYTIVQLT